MTRVSFLLIGLLALAVSFSALGSGVFNPGPAVAAEPIRIGSIAESRFATTWTLNGSFMTNTRAKLLATGKYSITDVAGTLTPSVLANFDIFFIGWLTDSSSNAFTSAELAALQTWLNTGGVLIVTCDDPQHDAVCAFFGYPAANSAVNPMKPTGAHSIFNGPYGTVTSFSQVFTQGYFTATTGATILANDSSVPPRPVFLERRAAACSDLILFSDVDIISNGSLSAGTTFTNDNDKVLGNLFAYAGSIVSSAPCGTQARVNPNIGAAIGAIVAGADGTRDNLARQAQAQAAAQQAAGAAAAAAAAAQTAPVLRPPSTGDGGLVGRQDETQFGIVGISLAGGLVLIVAGLVRGRTKTARVD